MNLMQYANKEWQDILSMANQNVNLLMLPDTIKKIDFIIKINLRVADSVGHMYLAYLRQIFEQMLKIYGHYSFCISNAISSKQN